MAEGNTSQSKRVKYAQFSWGKKIKILCALGFSILYLFLI